MAKINKNRNPDDVRLTTAWKKQYERNHKIVKARFINHESPGGTLNCIFARYPDCSDCSKSMVSYKDGEVYDITLMMYEHINNDCRYPVHHYEVDEYTQQPTKKVGRFIPRFSFVPMLYTDETMQSGPNVDLITVESLC